MPDRVTATLADAAGVRSERDKQHSPDFVGRHERLGQAWAAILGDWMGRTLPPIPPQVCLLMMGAQKGLRCVGDPIYQRDDLMDLLAYAAMSDGLRTNTDLAQSELPFDVVCPQCGRGHERGGYPCGCIQTKGQPCSHPR
jgi:hypothetical protein